MQEPKLIDIYPVVGTSLDYYLNTRTILTYVGLFVLAFGIAGALIYYLYRYFTSAHNRARRRLNYLQKQPCATYAQGRDTVSHLSHIVRTFLIQTYCLGATGMTDAELVSFLQTKITDIDIIKKAKQLLLATQQVRFSQGQAGALECKRLIEEAKQFINKFPQKK